MKAIFVGAHGALLERDNERCLLRCGAGAGLRLLVELDFRIVVVDDTMTASAALADTQPVARLAPPRRRPDNGARRRTDSASASLGGGAQPRWSGAPAFTGDGEALVDRLDDLLFREQLALQGYYRCRHGQTQKQAQAHAPRSTACLCHPPQPALLLQAAFEHRINLSASWLVGARLDDIEAGNRAGCRTVLIDNGSETCWQLGRGRVPNGVAPDLYGAALFIGERGESGQPGARHAYSGRWQG